MANRTQVTSGSPFGSLPVVDQAAGNNAAGNNALWARLDEEGLRQVTEAMVRANLRLEEFRRLPAELAGFLAALAKAPADRTLLSVFADWLEEQQHALAGRFRDLAR